MERTVGLETEEECDHVPKHVLQKLTGPGVKGTAGPAYSRGNGDWKELLTNKKTSRSTRRTFLSYFIFLVTI